MSGNETTVEPTEQRIDVRPKGPLLVHGSVRLQLSDGSIAETKKTLALCRCGQSSTKPYCDGTHAKVGFDGAETADAAPGAGRKDYAGQGITIHDDRALCAHAGACTAGLPNVWRMKQSPWIDADGADVQAIIETIRNCPSGALTYSLPNGEQRPTSGGQGVEVIKDGPYRVEGGLPLAGAQGTDYGARPLFTLCRCGASKNKPYCDGSHWDAGFKDG